MSDFVYLSHNAKKIAKPNKYIYMNTLYDKLSNVILSNSNKKTCVYIYSTEKKKKKNNNMKQNKIIITVKGGSCCSVFTLSSYEFYNFYLLY